MIAKDALLEMLGRTMLFGALEDADRKAIMQEMRETSYDGGQAIFARGDAGRDVYLVTSGRVRLSVLTAEGRELSFAHAEPGHIFGAVAEAPGHSSSPSSGWFFTT